MEVGNTVWFADLHKLRAMEGTVEQIGLEGVENSQFPKEFLPHYVEFPDYENMFIMRKHLFHTKKEALDFLKQSKNEIRGELLQNNKWIVDMFEAYLDANEEMSDLKENILKEIIKEKLGIDL